MLDDNQINYAWTIIELKDRKIALMQAVGSLCQGPIHFYNSYNDYTRSAVYDKGPIDSPIIISKLFIYCTILI